MGRLHRLGSVVLRIYPNDHAPPHFHVISTDGEAMVEIETLRLLRGQLPDGSRREILAWAEANAAEIKGEWNRINPANQMRS